MILSTRAQLEDLLLAMFGPGALRRELVRMDEDLDRALPSDRVPPEELAHAAVGALIERRLDNAALFDHLAALRPGCEAEIARVRDIWSQRDRRRFVVVYESERPELDIADILDGLAEARQRTGDPTLRVVKVYKGSARWVFEGREATAWAPLSAWFPRRASIREEPERGERPGLLAPRERLSSIALARVGGQRWSTLDRLRLDAIWGEGESLEFRAEAPSTLESDALERALRLAELMLALSAPPDVALARRVLPITLDLGGARWGDGGLQVPLRDSSSLFSVFKGPGQLYSRLERMFYEDHRDSIYETFDWLAGHVNKIGEDRHLHLPLWTTRPPANEAPRE